MYLSCSSFNAIHFVMFSRSITNLHTLAIRAETNENERVIIL